MRLCPNAVKVLPDPPPAKLTAALSPRPQVELTAAGSKDQASSCYNDTPEQAEKLEIGKK